MQKDFFETLWTFVIYKKKSNKPWTGKQLEFDDEFDLYDELRDWDLSCSKDELKSCYKTALDLANLYDLESIGFTAISCGIFGYVSRIWSNRISIQNVF